MKQKMLGILLVIGTAVLALVLLAHCTELKTESKYIRNPEEQSFDVELDDWGEVRFVSYAPDKAALMKDISFSLVQDDQIVYTFPAYDETGMLKSVDEVGFPDIDGDNKKDVIVIMTYYSGAGPQGMAPRKAVRIFRADGSEFILCKELMLDIRLNMDDSELSISAVCAYMEEKEG